MGSLGARVATWLRQTYCGLHGHDSLMHFGKERMFLQCATCGHETPGWELTEAPPRVYSEPRRHVAVAPPLVSERRVA